MNEVQILYVPSALYFSYTLQETNRLICTFLLTIFGLFLHKIVRLINIFLAFRFLILITRNLRILLSLFSDVSFYKTIIQVINK